ncbi:transglutaminase-like domain-containing protein [Helicobacter sp.]|uniref:transglutaminase-like domain-containing protein n=1 Tax=Helicobacter sp. TaxID=218 RepID=UPI0019C19D87|nr:transglutaminase-like domain-containing protein [Helicobacter sp.]MBD5164441.1 transglutaminase domain-containing protein [Helicobacter sp.]
MYQIDTKRQYSYTSSCIRPFDVQEYFPLKIDINKAIFKNALLCPPPPENKPLKAREANQCLQELFVSLQGDFEKRQKSIERELNVRGIPKQLAFCFYLNVFIHKSKHYTPRELKESVQFATLIEYFIKLQYGHCGQKSYALCMLLENFGIEARVISYSDIFGWAHGFCEVFINEKWQILDPTFNMYFDIGVQEIIKNPYCKRKILSFYSNEFWVDKSQGYEQFIQTQIDANHHTTFKYNKEWFMFMGFYPFVPPILYFNQINNGQKIELYDIRKDTRYQFV